MKEIGGPADRSTSVNIEASPESAVAGFVARFPHGTLKRSVGLGIVAVPIFALPVVAVLVMLGTGSMGRVPYVALKAGLAAVEAALLPHESVRIFLDFCRMVLQISLQGRMVLHKFLVIYERRIFAKLLGNFAVAVQELIEIRQFLAGSVVVLNRPILGGRGLPTGGLSKAEKSC